MYDLTRLQSVKRFKTTGHKKDSPEVFQRKKQSNEKQYSYKKTGWTRPKQNCSESESIKKIGELKTS